MDFEKTRNGTGETDDDYTNIHFIVGDRREIASFRPDQVTNKELKGEKKILFEFMYFKYYS